MRDVKKNLIPGGEGKITRETRLYYRKRNKKKKKKSTNGTE